MQGIVNSPGGDTVAHLPAQSAFASWRSRVGSYPFPVAITASGDRAAAPWVTTESNEAPPRQLTAGSDLNKTAEGPWLNIIDAGTIDFSGAWPHGAPYDWKVPSTLREIYHQNIGGNYGSVTSLSNFSWRNWLFNANEPLLPAIGNLPISPDPRRPMWNNLPAVDPYRQRVTNPNAIAGFNNNVGVEDQNAYSVTFTPTGVASLNPSGATQGEVLL